MPVDPAAVERWLQAAVDQGFERSLTDPVAIAKIAAILRAHLAEQAQHAEREVNGTDQP